MKASALAWISRAEPGLLWRVEISQLLLSPLSPSQVMGPSLSLQTWAQQWQRVNCPPHLQRIVFSSQKMFLFTALSHDFVNQSLCSFPPIWEFRQQNSGSSTQGASKSLTFCKSNGSVQKTPDLHLLSWNHHSSSACRLPKVRTGGNLYRKSPKRDRNITEDNSMPHTCTACKNRAELRHTLLF